LSSGSSVTVSRHFVLRRRQSQHLHPTVTALRFLLTNRLRFSHTQSQTVAAVVPSSRATLTQPPQACGERGRERRIKVSNGRGIAVVSGAAAPRAAVSIASRRAGAVVVPGAGAAHGTPSTPQALPGGAAASMALVSRVIASPGIRTPRDRASRLRGRMATVLMLDCCAARRIPYDPQALLAAYLAGRIAARRLRR
jgi:hypothetical protein